MNDGELIQFPNREPEQPAPEGSTMAELYPEIMAEFRKVVNRWVTEPSEE